MSPIRNSSLSSDPSESAGMSDEEELRRYALAHAALQGVGEEVYVELEEDFRELGIDV